MFFHSMDEDLGRLRKELEERPEPLGVSVKGSILDVDSWKKLAAAAPALLYVGLYPVDKILGLPSWLGAVMARQAILSGVRAGAASATGMDMLGAAFEEARTCEPPDGVTVEQVPSEIETEIETDLANQGAIDLATLRESIDPKRRATLLSAIDSAFRDVGKDFRIAGLP